MHPKYCSNCGTKAAYSTAQFCSSCGKPFASAAFAASKNPTRQLDEEGSDITHVPQIDKLDCEYAESNVAEYQGFQAGAAFSILPDGMNAPKKFKPRRLS